MLQPKRLLILFCFFLASAYSASTLVHNISGYTTTNAGLLQFEGLLFDDHGRIKQTLDQQSVDSLITENKTIKLIDGGGKFLLPGLIDAHGHILGYGHALTSVDLVGSPSVAEAVARVAKFAEQNPDQQWITGRGWNQVLWKNKKFPSAETLDNAIPGRPVALSRIDGHAVWLNSQAMRLAGIDRHTLDPDGGEIIRDQQGNPTGVLVDNAMVLVSRKIPPLSMDNRLILLTKSLQALVTVGISSVHDAGVPPITIDALKILAKQEKLPVRVYAMLSVNKAGFAEAIAKGPEKSLFDDRISVQSIKLSIDGALGSRGAALDEPYSDRPDTSGLLLHTEVETEVLIIGAMQAGFQVNSHAIGDRGNRLLLDIFAKYPQYQALRNRIEHAQVVHVEDILRFKALNVIASVQPTHATSDKNMAKQRLGEKRLAGAYAWRKFLNLDVILASGSDFPVEPANPFFGLHAAVTRQDRDNQPAGGWRSEERMSREEALRSFTLDAAYAAHQEKVLGSLEPGKWADFIIVDQDYFKVAPENIWKIKVLQTWQAGKKVYDIN